MCNEEQEIPRTKGENGLEELAESQFYYYYRIWSHLNQENFTNALMKFLEIKENSVVALVSYLTGTRAKWYGFGVRPPQVHEITSRG